MAARREGRDVTPHNSDPEDTIYYCMTATPNIKNHTAFGPIHGRKHNRPLLLQKLQEKSPVGLGSIMWMLDYGGI